MAQNSNEKAKKVVSTLTDKAQVLFWEYISNGRNATQAATKAKYSNPKQAGNRVVNSAKFQRALQFFMQTAVMEAEEVKKRLSEQAAAAYAQYFKQEDRTYKYGKGDNDYETRSVLTLDLDRLIADDKGHLIKGIKQTQYGQVIEFYDAHTALVDMGRVHGIFNKDNQRTNLDVDYGSLSDNQLERIAKGEAIEGVL